MLDVGFFNVLVLWAATGKTRLFYTLAILAGTLLVAAFIIRQVERWRKKQDVEQYSPGDQLTEFRELYEAGEISKEEFAQIRRQLGGMLREELLGDEAAKSAEKPNAPPDDKPPPDWNIQIDRPDS